MSATPTGAWDAVDLFAGAGGWDIAAQTLGLDVVGVEVDAAACATRAAAGLTTMQGDVRALSPCNLPTRGLIASPPCQTFSMGGKGSGRRALDSVISAARRMASHSGLLAYAIDDPDERTGLVLEPLRWIMSARDDGAPYEWVAMEQVPAVRPMWDVFAEILRGWGYDACSAILNAEQFGVPQTRKRAILIARLGSPARMPEPTHSRYYPRTPDRLDPGVARWVTMAEALSGAWGGINRPATTVTGGGTSTGGAEPFGNGARKELAKWVGERPATTVQGDPRLGAPGRREFIKGGASMFSGDIARLAVEEAGVLQTFPPDYPWQGTKGQRYQQIGNAIPPLLALRILEEASGCGAAEGAP